MRQDLPRAMPGRVLERHADRNFGGAAAWTPCGGSPSIGRIGGQAVGGHMNEYVTSTCLIREGAAMRTRTGTQPIRTRNLSRRGFLTGTVLTLAAGLAACSGAQETPESTDSQDAGQASPAPDDGTQADAAPTSNPASASSSTSMVGSPWVTSNLAGNLEADYEPTPRDDFYVSACGAWLREQRLQEGQRDYMPLFDDARATVRDSTIALLEGNPLDDPTLHSLQNAFELMRSDLAHDERGLADLEAELDRIAALDSIGALTAYLTEREPTFWGAPFVSFDVVPDEGEGEGHVVVVTVRALTTYADREEYARHTVEGARELECARSVFYLVLGDTDMAGDAEEAFGASYAWQAEAAAYVRDPAETGTAPLRLGRDALVSMAGPFPLAGILDAWGLGSADDFEISAADADALTFLGKTYGEERLLELTSVVLTSLVHEVARGPVDYLTTDIRDGVREILGIDVEDSGGLVPASDPAIDTGALTELIRVVPTTVERLFSDAHATDSRQEVVTGLAADVTAAYRDLVGGTPWLSPETVETAQDRLATLRVVALRPVTWADDELTVSSFANGETLWSARLKLEAARRRRLAALAGAEREADEFPRGHSHLDVVSVYDAACNTLFVPSGMVVTGLLEPDLTRERMLAGAGMLFAHEVSRSFTGEGALFDGEGRRHAWWNTDDWAAYNERAEHVVAWFDDVYRPLGEQIEDLGRRVLKETLADFCAMRVTLSLAAPDSLDLADLFGSYAQCHLRLMDEDALGSFLDGSESAPDATAVNLTLAQFDEFQSAFGVSEGDAMYVAADDRLLIW